MQLLQPAGHLQQLHGKNEIEVDLELLQVGPHGLNELRGSTDIVIIEVVRNSRIASLTKSS